jgi:hypothetical protein
MGDGIKPKTTFIPRETLSQGSKSTVIRVEYYPRALRYITYSTLPSMAFLPNQYCQSTEALPSASPHQNLLGYSYPTQLNPRRRISPPVISTKKMKYIVGPNTRCCYRVLVASLRCKLTSHQRCSQHSVHKNSACSVPNSKFIYTSNSLMLTHFSILLSTSIMKTHKQLTATQAFPTLDIASQLPDLWIVSQANIPDS